MIQYIENPEDAIRKLLELISEVNKAVRCKINAWNLLKFHAITTKVQIRN